MKAGRPTWGDGTFSVGQLPLMVDAAPLWYSARLPVSYYAPEVLANLAPDAQLYYACPACSRHWRVNPSLIGTAGFACPCSPRTDLEPERLRPRLVFLCHDCGNEFANFANPWDRPGRCPRCLSRRSMVWSVKAVKRSPEVFFGVPVRPIPEPFHRWGVNLNADLTELAAERDLVLDLPDAERHLIPMALFTERLRAMAETGTDQMWFQNFEANTLQESYKMTTDITAGWTALRLFWDAAMAARQSAFAEAHFTHNVALAAFSLLAIGTTLVIASTEDGDLLRDIGLGAAGRSRELYEAGAGTGRDLAMVRYVMGNLCSTSSRPDLLIEALEHYDVVLAAADLPPGAREDAEAKRLRAEAELIRRSGAGAS